MGVALYSVVVMPYCYHGNKGREHEMTTVALTERRIRDAKPRAADWTLWDAEVKGFGVRVAPGGAKSYLLMYRAGGRQRRWTFGRAGEMGLAEARNVARREMATIRLGEGDPASKRQEDSAAPTVADALDRFFREYAPHRVDQGRLTPRTVADYAAQTRRTVRPRLGNIRIADVTPADIERAVSKVAPVQRNRTLAFVHRLFTLCETWEYRPQHTNPAHGIEKAREYPRDRTLDPSETAALGKALADLDDPFAVGALKFLVLTGWRTGEALGVHWDHVNFETGVVELPSTKTGRDVRSVSDLAMKLLADMPRVHGEPRIFLVSHATLRRRFKRVLKAAGIDDCTLHDIRRTVATEAARSGVSVLMLRDLLGHKTVAMANRYARRAGSALVDAQDASSARMGALLEGGAGEVVPLRKAE